jgi:hypothetical protein
MNVDSHLTVESFQPVPVIREPIAFQLVHQMGERVLQVGENHQNIECNLMNKLE